MQYRIAGRKGYMNISICIITKNECEKLRRCIAQASKLGFEMVVVDTGSTDGTLSMLPEYTDSVYHFEWINDFAAAKNYAAKCAKNDMVMILDSDEYLRLPEDEKELILFKQEVLSQIEAHANQVGRMVRINDVYQGYEITKYTDYTNRIFDRRLFCFKGAIHEQLVKGNVFDGPCEVDLAEKDVIFGKAASEANSCYVTYISKLTADHDGYVGTKEERSKKALRNIELLKKELEKRPEDTYILYQLGKGYFLLEDFEMAAEYFGIALSYEVEPSLEYVQDMVETYGYALIETNRAGEAVLLESVMDEFGHSSDFMFMLGLAYMNNAEFDKAVAAFEKATRVQPAKMEGVDSYLAYYNCGVIYEVLGDKEKARIYYKKCGSYEKALIRLKECV